ncbi:MAG: hypothetical protein V4492_08020 [Chlamydiota bacterium]
MSSLSFKIQPMIDSGSTFIYDMPRGKPDVKAAPLTPENEHSRPLTEQKPQKGGTCYFYSMNFLRLRVGPNPSPEYAEARKTEALISGFRKEISAIGPEATPEYVSRVSARYESLFQDSGVASFDRKTLQERKEDIQSQMKLIEEALNAEAPGFAGKMEMALERFQQQTRHDDFFEFIQKDPERELRKICFKFLENLTGDPEGVNLETWAKYISEARTITEGRKYSPEDPEIRALAQKVSPFEREKKQVGKLHMLAHEKAAQAFGLQFAPWIPSMPPSALLETLKTHGPLLVVGEFGHSHYSAPSEIRESIGDTPIYGWLAKERIREDQGDNINHAIVLIGAKAEGAAVVYYLDPRHGVEKIHRMSYNTLIAHTMHSGSMRNFERTWQAYPPGFAEIKRYAQFHPRNAV